MMSRVIMPMTIALATLVGCAINPASQALRVELRAMPTIEYQDAKAAVIDTYSSRLKEADSARFTFYPRVVKGSVHLLVSASIGNTAGSWLCGTVNAKPFLALIHVTSARSFRADQHGEQPQALATLVLSPDGDDPRDSAYAFTIDKCDQLYRDW